MSVEYSLKTTISSTPNFDESILIKTYLSSAPVMKSLPDQSNAIEEIDAGLVS